MFERRGCERRRSAFSRTDRAERGVRARLFDVCTTAGAGVARRRGASDSVVRDCGSDTQRRRARTVGDGSVAGGDWLVRRTSALTIVRVVPLDYLVQSGSKTEIGRAHV